MQEEFQKERDLFFPNPNYADQAAENRRPLIFKIEKGPVSTFVGLCSKSYFLGKMPKTHKFSQFHSVSV